MYLIQLKKKHLIYAITNNYRSIGLFNVWKYLKLLEEQRK